jgi:hypothetical protein
MSSNGQACAKAGARPMVSAMMSRSLPSSAREAGKVVSAT